MLTALARRFGRVVLTDVAGVRANDADLEFLQLASRRRPIWADAGSRYADDAMDLFIAGAETVTMRWNTLDDVDELAQAVEVCQPGTLFLGLEYPRGRFLGHRSDTRDAAEVVRFAEELGVGIVFLLDHASDELLRSLPVARTPRFVQGATHVAAAQEMGFAGAMVAPSALPEETSP